VKEKPAGKKNWNRLASFTPAGQEVGSRFFTRLLQIPEEISYEALAANSLPQEVFAAFCGRLHQQKPMMVRASSSPPAATSAQIASA